MTRKLVWLGLLFVGCQGGSGAKLSSRVAPGVGQGSSAHSPLLGENTASSLASLQYSIRTIQICESLQTSGTAYNQPTNCLTLFDRAADARYDYKDPTADLHAMASLARASDDHFIDLLDETSRATLATSTALGAEHVHDYHWGLVTWDLPIKLRADIPMSDGSTLHTHDGQTLARQQTGGGSGYWYQTVAAKNFDTGSAETAVVMLPNGGTWFRFQNPLTITQADLAAGTQFSLDLAFNPEGLIKASSADNAPSMGPLTDAAGRTIQVPLLDLSPVPHRENETVMRETWVARVSGASAMGADDFDVRLELYSVAEDPAKTIYSVALTSLVNSHTTRPFMQTPRISFISSSGNTLTFEDWSHTAVISGFERTQSVGGTASATLHCGGNSMRLAGCGDTGGDGALPVTFSLSTITAL